jgi:protein-disulfide isomerase
MKETETTSFFTTPNAILIGSFVIAVAILISGGVIKVGKFSANPVASPAPAAAAGAQKEAKTEAEIIKGLKTYAGKLGLDQGKFDKCLDSGEKEPLVSADTADGTTAGVNGTPAFFINGRLISGAAPFADFKKVIDEELNGTAASTVTREVVAVGNLPAEGESSAKVTMVEFSDYQCPFCGRFYTQTELQLKKEYIDTGKIKFYYRDFPLTQIHPGAEKGAEAARCAGDQNKYWEYHNIVFQNQDNIF